MARWARAACLLQFHILTMVLFMTLPAQALELVIFERASCAWCQRWHAEIGPAYGKSPEGGKAPLRRVDLDAAQSAELQLNAPVRFTPTFVLADGGRETGRITGYQDNATFWGLLAAMLAKRETPDGKKAAR